MGHKVYIVQNMTFFYQSEINMPTYPAPILTRDCLDAVHKVRHVGKNETFCVQNLDAFALDVTMNKLNRLIIFFKLQESVFLLANVRETNH